jgi:hypothetical protein
VLGVVEAFFAIRVGFDAGLFRWLAAEPGAPDVDGIDTALIILGLITDRRAERSAAERIAGASRLLYRQASMLGLQLALIVAAALVAWA